MCTDSLWSTCIYPLSDNGWKVREGCLEIDWDDDQNSEQVKENVCLCCEDVGVRRVATLKDALAVKLVDIVGLVVGVAFVKLFPALSRYRKHLRQKQVMKWKQKSWRMISTSDISITLKW